MLFLDDLQWASTESLRLLSAVLTTGNITGLFVLGACRSDEVSADDDLSRTLRKLENDEKVKLTEIRVQNLDEDTVAALVAQRTLLPTGQSDYLSGFIYKYTKGNPAYTVQMLQALQDTGWRTMQNSKNVLAFGLKGLGSDNLDTLENFIRWRLQSLDGDMREVLTTAACMGNEFDAHWINMAVKYPTEDLLNKAVLLQWLVHVSNATPRYRFIHDKVQQAAYALIDDQPAFHLQIGRRIWKSVDHVEGNAIMILNQLRLATHLLTTEQDRVAVAELCLVAGKDAERISSFNEASSHFALGRSLLPRRPWRDCYHLALDLFSSGAEVEYAIGNFETTDILVDAILNNARSPQDQLPAYTIHIYSLGSRSRLQDALKTGLLVLEKLKVPLPRKAGPLRIQYELRKTQRLLKNVSDDAILGLPGMTDENKLSAMQIMNIMFTYAFSISPRHSLMIALRLTQLSLADGVSALSATGFAFYSMMLCIALGQPNDGYRYGQVALRLLDRFNSHEWMPRVYCVVYGMVNTNKLTTRQSIAPLSKAHKIGLASGDTEFSMMSLHLCTCCQFYSAEPLPYQFVDYKYYRQLMLTFKQNNILQLHNVFLQTVANLLGEGEGDPFNLTGEFLVEAEVLAECKEQNNMTLSQSIFTFKLMIAYLLNRYEDANTILNLTDESSKVAIGGFTVCFHVFLVGLVDTALARTVPKRRHRQCRRAKQSLKYLERAAETAPCNYQHRVHHLRAEMAAVAFDGSRAVEEYDRSIELASRGDYTFEQALAIERKGIYLCEIGRIYEGVPCLLTARQLYEKWGCRIKVEAMRGLTPYS